MDRPAKRAVLMFSGGPDSTTLLYDLKNRSQDVAGIVFNYGQDYAENELAAAKGTANRLNIPLEVIDLSGLRPTLLGLPLGHGHSLMGGSGSGGCGDAHMLIGMAAVFAGLTGASSVNIAYHAGDVEAIPTLPDFVKKFEEASRLMPGTRNVTFELPYLEMDKAAVLRIGSDLGVPFELTVSCQTGQVLHCGKCERCEQRQAAFQKAGLADPTRYATS